MALDTVAIGIYVCDFPVRPNVYCDARTQSCAACRRGAAANLNPGNRRVWACVCRVGVDVPRDSCWHRILPTAFVGWFSPPSHRFNSVSDLALENGSATNSGALAYVLHYRFFVAWRWKRWGVPGGAHRSFGRDRTIGGDGFAVDGYRGLAAPGRHAARRSRSCRIIARIRGVNNFGRAEEPGRIGPRRSIWGRPVVSRLVGVGQRVSLLDLFRGAFRFTLDGRGDAEPCGRSFTLDRGNTVRRGQHASLECDIGAFLGGDGVSDCVWVDGRVYGLHLYFEEKHGNARSDLCVCESGGGALSWVVVDRRIHQFANDYCRGSDLDRCLASDYRASSCAATG